MTSPVSAVAAADAAQAAAHFHFRLSVETDCWDVHDSIRRGVADFVLLDVRSRALYAQSRLPSAISLPHAEISEQTLSEWPADTLFVVYCAGPHCNGAHKAALHLAQLGRPVKQMIGGVTGWADEDLPFVEPAAGDGA